MSNIKNQTSQSAEAEQYTNHQRSIATETSAVTNLLFVSCHVSSASSASAASVAAAAAALDLALTLALAFARQPKERSISALAPPISSRVTYAGHRQE